jgi:hypothetical protein
VQDEQLRFLADLNRNLDGRLAKIEDGLFEVASGVGRIQADLRVQLAEPWKTAQLFLRHAAEPDQRKETRKDYLRNARDKLFEAHSVAENSVARALIAQRLTGISLMLGDGPSARRWLLEAYPVAVRLAIETAAEVQKLFVVAWNADSLRLVQGGGLLRSDTVDRPGRPTFGRLGQAYRPQQPWSASEEDRSLPFVPMSEPAGRSRTSAETFWMHFIKASAEDRAGVVNCTRIVDQTLAGLVQVKALLRLHLLTQDLESQRAVGIQLGTAASSLPRRRMYVDLLPLRMPEIALKAA